MNRFIIGFVGRTGSSYLEGLLDSHPDIVCDPEIFSVNGPFDLSGLSYDDFLASLSAGRLASGFKLGIEHMKARAGIDAALRRQNYSVILLHRENLLDQFISMRLAQINEIWRSDRGDYKAQSFVADPAHAIACMKSFEEQNDYCRSFLSGMTVFEITYETITTRLPALMDWLGVVRTDLSSKYNRQRSARTQADAVENYNELADAVAGTRYAHHLETFEVGKKVAG